MEYLSESEQWSKTAWTNYVTTPSPDHMMRQARAGLDLALCVPRDLADIILYACHAH